MSKKNLRILKKMIYVLIILFIINFLPLGVVSLFLSVIYIALGIVLIVLTSRSEVKGKLKVFLLLTGFSSAGLLLGLIHGFLEIWGFDVLQVVFFYTGVIISPIIFLIGAIGSIILFRKMDRY